MRDEVRITWSEAMALASDAELHRLLGGRMTDAGWPVAVSPFTRRILVLQPGLVENWHDDRERCIVFRWTPADKLSPTHNTQPTARPGILQSIRAAGRYLGAMRRLKP